MCKNNCNKDSTKCLCYILTRLEQIESDVLNADSGIQPTSLSYDNSTGILSVGFADGMVRTVTLPVVLNTSDLVNDGEDGTNPFVTLDTMAVSILTSLVSGNKIAEHNDGNGNVVDINETITSVVTQGTSFVFTDEAGNQTSIDISNLETLTSIDEDTNGTFSYTDEAGNETIVSKASLTDNGDGTYTFSNNSGITTVTIDTNSYTVTNTISGHLIATLTDSNGNSINIEETLTEVNNTQQLGNIIATHKNENGLNTDIKETITLLEVNGSQVTYSNENGDSLSFDISDLETLTSIIDNGDGTFSYTDESGNTTQIPKAQLTDNGNNTYTFTNNDGTDVTIVSNIYDISNTVSGNRIASLTENGLDKTDINETVTSISESNGVVTYQKEDGNTDTFNIPTSTQDVINEGSDGNSTYVENDEIVTLANDGLDLRNINNTSEFIVDEFLQLQGGTFDSSNKRWSVDSLQARTIFIRSGALLSIAEPFNETKPYPTLKDAISAYKNLSISYESSNYRPFINFVVLDGSTQQLDTIGVYRPIGQQHIVNIISEGNINIVNNDTSVTYCPFSVIGTYNDVPTRKWDSQGSIITNGNVTFSGSGAINFGEQRNLNQIKCNTLTLGSNHTINSISRNSAVFDNIKKIIEVDNLVLNGGTNKISGGLKNLEVILRKVTINSVTNGITNLTGSNSIFEFNEIESATTFVMGRADGKIIHGDIYGSYTGTEFAYSGTNVMLLEYKNNVTIDLPVYFSGQFNSICDIKLIGNEVTYSNTPYLFRDFVKGTGGDTSDGDNIGFDINLRELNIPNGSLCKFYTTSPNGIPFETNQTGVARYGAGTKLTNCTLNLQGYLNAGVTVDGSQYSNFPPILLEVIGDCYINSQVPNGTIILTNTGSGTTGNGRFINKGSLTISNGIIDTSTITEEQTPNRTIY